MRHGTTLKESDGRAEANDVKETAFATPAMVAGACLVAGVTLAGCGKSHSGRLTAAQLAQQGSAICQRAEAEEKALHSQNLRAALPRLQEIAGHQVADLAKLSPPRSEQASYYALLGEASRLVGLLRTLASATAHGASAPPELLARGREAAGRLEQLDRPLGLGVCSAPTSSP